MNKDKENKPKVTAKEIYNYSPHENAWTEVCFSGNVVELKVLERKAHNNLSHIKKLNKHEYYDTKTGEVKQYRHEKREKNPVRNMNRSFEKLRQLINTNFTGAINELHITLTYSEKMNDFDKASKDFKRFWEKLHYYYPDVEFIRIIEPHQSDSWHIHLLLKTIKYGNLRIEQKEIETLWEHGIVKIKKTTGYDNVGAYFSVQLKHHAPIAETIDKQHAKSERLLFYPPNKQFYGYSKGIAKPIIFCTTYQEALKLVDEKYLIYSSSMEIDLEYENADEKVTVNRIHRRQYNKKRTRKGE